MPGQYIAFLYDSSQPIAAMPAGGLPLRRAIAEFGKGIALRIHASAQIPILDLADGGILIGQVFDHSGTAISDGGQLIDSTDSTGLRDHLLGNLWGDYVAIQPLPDASGFSVLNTPSCSSTLPCLYHFEQGRGFITSHASLAIRAGLYRKEVDWNHIARFLTFPYLRTEHTALWGLLELLPGMLASVHESGVITELAWTPWSFVRPSHRQRSLGDAATAVRDAVERVVRTLASADQRILLELSGGLDSSIVGSCLRDHGAAITCASLVAQTPGADERMYAALIANLLGTALHEVPLPVEAARFRFADAADAVRPSVGLLQYAIDSVMEMEAAGVHSASAFSGGGGDAVFGYLRTAAPAVDAWKENGLLAGLQSVRDLATLHRCTAWQALRLTIHKAFRKPVAPYPPDRSFLAASALAAGELDHPWYQAPAGSLPGDRERIFALAGNQIFMDYVPRRASRAFRMPLLAQPVIEACLRAPSWMWISGGHNRAVARAAFADQLPAGILARRSKGTLTGYLGEIYQQQKHDMLDFLLSGNLRSQGMLDIDALQRFVSSHPPPRDRTFIRVMDLCKVENWTRQQMDGLDHLR